MKTTQAIQQFLTRTAGTNRDLIERWNAGTEVQLNVDPSKGHILPGRKNVWLFDDGRDAFEFRNIRIPANAKTDPIDNDGELDAYYQISEVALAIGSTGWDWKNRQSKWLGFDIDAIEGHAEGLSDEQLDAIRAMVEPLDYVELRHSKSGKGLHLYVHVDGIKAENHTVHAQLGKAILQKISRDLNHPFKDDIDVCGGNMWIWHRDAKENGFTLLKSATRKLSEDELPEWRQSNANEEICDELVRDQQERVPLSQNHKEVIAEVEKLGWPSTWNEKKHLWHTHSKGLAEVAAKYRIDFQTISPGTDKATPNCYCYPRPYGFDVHKFGGNEDSTWSTNSRGQPWTRFIFPTATPTIKINTELHRMVDESTAALAHADNTYVYGTALVEIVHDAKKPKLCLHDNGAPQLSPIEKPTLATRLSKCAIWKKYSDKKGKEGWLLARPDRDVVSAVHVASNWPSVPVITGIVSCPVLRSDGTILLTPGYDPETGLYLENGESWPGLMPPDEAIAILKDVVCDFPFEDDSHFSAWLAFLVTMLVRPAFKGSAPFFLVDANASRTGKGLLTDVTTMIVEGRKASRYSWSKDNEETRKLITTVGMSGSPYLLFDNVKTTLGGPALEQAMTAGVWADRLLSLNRQVSFPIRFIFAGTSNNAKLTRDMIGRTCHIRLYTDLENPGERDDFRHRDLLAHVKQQRPKLVMATLSIPAAFIQAGQPEQGLTPWGGFEAWSDLVRGSIVWAGLDDPGTTRTGLAEQADDETGLLKALAHAWPVMPVSIVKAIELSTEPEYQTLGEVLSELPGRDLAKQLPYLLRDARGRNLGGRRFERVENARPTKWASVEA